MKHFNPKHKEPGDGNNLWWCLSRFYLRCLLFIKSHIAGKIGIKPKVISNKNMLPQAGSKMPLQERMRIGEKGEATTPKLILVAEDNEFNFIHIKALLTRRNYRLIHAKNGEEAVTLHRKHSEIALIVMDIQMPVMDGYEATEEIRKVDQTIPVIAYTAYFSGKARAKAFSSGCNDVVIKPAEPEVFINTISNYLG